ncbi:MAG: hypothetical protein J7L14_00410 [Candidatus Diapherotrites archaeon]|nr:hypothetical protein [Candidatus Diapherotrites archaeon]
MLKAALEKYNENLKAALAFAILLIFMPVFYILNSTTITSTNIFWNYIANPGELMFSVMAIFAFFAIASALHATIIFATKKSLAEAREQSFIAELPRYSLQIFLYYVLVTMLCFGIVMLFPTLPTIVIAIILFVFLMFVPQSIVVEENNLLTAILNSAEFVKKNSLLTIWIVVVCSLLTVLAAVFEFALDIIFYALNIELKGAIFSAIIILLFVIPYTETLKSIAYMKKFELLVPE